MPETHAFQETLSKLRLLQKILNQKFDLEKKITELPKEVILKEDMVFRMKENFLVANEQYQELKKSVMLKNDELNRLQQHRDKYETEITFVSSQRDYEQIDRAIKENLDLEQIMRNELMSLEKKLDKFSEEFVIQENLLKDQEQELGKLKKEVENQLLDYQKNLLDVKNEETKITEKLDIKLTFKFERIIKSKGGDGIVPVRKNICNGCHMILPLQFVNEICKEEEMHHCPYCSRILFFDGEYLDDSAVVGTAGLQDLFDEDEIEFDDFSEEDYELFLDKDQIGSDAYSVPSEDDEDDDLTDDDLEIDDADGDEDDEELEDDEDLDDDLE